MFLFFFSDKHHNKSFSEKLYPFTTIGNDATNKPMVPDGKLAVNN